VAVASAGPYASLHLAPDRQPHQHPTTQFFTGRMPFLSPIQQHQSTEGKVCISVCWCLCAGALQGYLYAIGGNNGVASLDTCERYDPHLNKWTLIEPMKKRRAGAGVAQLHSQLYVVGTTHLCCRLTTLCSLHSQLIYAL